MLKKVPHTFVIIFGLIVFCAVLTWSIPGGEFEREMVSVNGDEREVIKSQSFQFIESDMQTWQIFSAFFDGFVNTANIIAFIPDCFPGSEVRYLNLLPIRYNNERQSIFSLFF